MLAARLRSLPISLTVEPIIKAIESIRASTVYMLPTMMNQLLQQSDTGRHRLNSLRRIISYNIAPSWSACEALRQRLPGVGLRHCYGMPQTCGTVIVQTPRHGKSGWHIEVVSGVEVLLTKTQGNPRRRKLARPGAEQTIGEIRVRGPSVMFGYLGDRRTTYHAIDRNGWFRTNDIGYRTDRGDIVIIKSPSRDVFWSRGFEASPSELEAIIKRYPGVHDVAVLSVPDILGEVPRAYVVPDDPDIDPEGIQEFVKNQVAAHKSLRGGVRFTKHIPREGIGAEMRRKLRKLFLTPSKIVLIPQSRSTIQAFIRGKDISAEDPQPSTFSQKTHAKAPVMTAEQRSTIDEEEEIEESDEDIDQEDEKDEAGLQAQILSAPPQPVNTPKIKIRLEGADEDQIVRDLSASKSALGSINSPVDERATSPVPDIASLRSSYFSHANTLQITPGEFAATTNGNEDGRTMENEPSGFRTPVIGSTSTQTSQHILFHYFKMKGWLSPEDVSDVKSDLVGITDSAHEWEYGTNRVKMLQGLAHPFPGECKVIAPHPTLSKSPYDTSQEELIRRKMQSSPLPLCGKPEGDRTPAYSSSDQVRHMPGFPQRRPTHHSERDRHLTNVVHEKSPRNDLHDSSTETDVLAASKAMHSYGLSCGSYPDSKILGGYRGALFDKATGEFEVRDKTREGIETKIHKTTAGKMPIFTRTGTGTGTAPDDHNIIRPSEDMPTIFTEQHPRIHSGERCKRPSGKRSLS